MERGIFHLCPKCNIGGDYTESPIERRIDITSVAELSTLNDRQLLQIFNTARKAHFVCNVCKLEYTFTTNKDSIIKGLFVGAK